MAYRTGKLMKGEQEFSDQNHSRKSSFERMGQTIRKPVVLEWHENRLFQHSRRP